MCACALISPGSTYLPVASISASAASTLAATRANRHRIERDDFGDDVPFDDDVERSARRRAIAINDERVADGEPLDALSVCDARRGARLSGESACREGQQQQRAYTRHRSSREEVGRACRYDRRPTSGVCGRVSGTMYRRTHSRQRPLTGQYSSLPHRRAPRSCRLTTGAQMPVDPIVRLRALCLALPEATEKLAWGAPTFRVKDKLFAMYAQADNHHGSGRPAVWVKAMPANQSLVIADDPARYFKPAYVGPSGWIGVWLDKRPPWAAVEALLEDGFRQVAPKKVLATMDGVPAPKAKRRNG